MSVLAKKIKYAYNNMGFISAFVYGHQGVGKTTYALKVMNKIYDDWDLVLRRTYFNLDLLIADLNEAFELRERIPVVLVDDAGIALLKYRWMKQSEQWFAKFFNLIRSVTAGFIFTSVEVGDVIKFVRDKIRYRIAVVRRGSDRAEARGYEVILLPSLEHTIRRAFVDRFSIKLPDNVRKQYEQKRRDAIARLFATNLVSENDILRRAKELQKQGFSWRAISEKIYSEYGVKHSYQWYRRHLQNVTNKH